MYRYPAQSTSIILLVINAFSTVVVAAAATGKERMTFFQLDKIFFVYLFFPQMKCAIKRKASRLLNEACHNSLKKAFWETKFFSGFY